jgi:hypothetical protein
MIGIILLVLGIVYGVKRPKIARLTASSSSGVPPHVFDEWKKCELRSIDVFLLATWGQGLFFLLLGLVFGASAAQSGDRESFDRLVTVLTIVQIVLVLGGLVVSAMYGSRASKLKSEFGLCAANGQAGGAFTIAPEASNTWALIGRILGAVALIPGPGLLFAPFAVLFGALGLKAYNRDPTVGLRGSALFAVVSGCLSVVVYGALFMSMLRA